MPTAARNAAPATAKVQETTIRKTVHDPVEVEVVEPAPEIAPQKDFWKYLRSLTDEDWKTHHCTLYRYPLGQPKPDKLGRYIKTYKHGNPLLNEEQIYDEFGGSQYTAMLRCGDSLVAKYSWEMDGPTKNPWQVSTGAGAAAPAGGSELASTLQVVLSNLQKAEKTGSAESPAIKESISLIQQLTQAMPKPQGVAELVAGLAELQKLNGGGGGHGGIIETIKVLKELGIIGESRDRRSLAAEVKEILEIAGMLNGGGGAPAGKQDWATSLINNLPTIIEKATPIADRFAEASRNNARVAEIRSGRTPAAPPPAAPARPAIAPAATVESPAPRVISPPETEPAAAAAAPQPAEPGQIAVQAPNLEWVKARAVQLFAAGKGGDEIAEWLDNLDKNLGDMLGSLDEEKFEAFVRTDPILSQIATAPRFAAFVSEFVGYFEESNEPDNEPAKES